MKRLTLKQGLLTTATLCLGGGAQLCTAAALAQSSPVRTVANSDAHKSVLEEVVVTASRKRKEDVQHTPVSVTALSAAVLERAHVTNITQVGKLAPSLQILPSSGAGSSALIYLRGFGQQGNDPATDPRVAVFVDGIYQPANTGNIFDLFDVQTIEVQAGPQGTLLGKNAPVGAVYITSAPPSNKLGGVVEATYGSYDHYTLKGKINVPLLKDSANQTILTSKFVFSDKSGGNWVYNDLLHKYDFGGESTQSYRAAFTFKPTPEFQWDLVGTYTHDNSPQGDRETANYAPAFAGDIGTATQVAPFPCSIGSLIGLKDACAQTEYGHSLSNFTSRGTSDTENISSNMHYSFAPVTLTLVTGYAGFWESDNVDDAGTPFVALNSYHSKTDYQQESAELRLSSNKGKGADLGGFVDWVGGMYFSNFDYSQYDNLGIGVAYPFPGTAPPPNIFPVSAGPNVFQFEKGNTKSEAAFAHIIFNFTKKFSATFGIRQSWDQKNHDVNLQNEGFIPDPALNFSNLSFEGGLAYQVTPRQLIYVRFAEGYEAGGYDGYSHNSGYQPETVKDYEVGIKTDWLDRRLRVNGTIFRNDLSNLQVESAEPSGNAAGFLQETLNAGAAIVEGVESQIIAVPVENFTTHLTLGYLSTHYTENNSTTCSNTAAPEDCSGLNFAQSPKWTIDVGGEYVADLPHEWGTATMAVDYAYKSSLYTSDPVYPYAYQRGYGLLSAGVTIQDPSEKYALEVFGTNITNVKYNLSFTDPAGLAGWYERGRPAEWGIRLTGKF